MKTALLFLLSFFVAAVLSCGDNVTEPVGNNGGGGDTTETEPDVLPPQPITDLSMIYSLDDAAAHLEWTAPWDDSLTEAVSGYVIRFTYTDPFIWDLTIRAANPPIPSPPGDIEHYAIQQPLRGRDLYAAIQSVDEEGNQSSISPIASVHVPGYSISGRCVDALGRQPIQGLTVRLTTGGIHQTVTDPGGGFFFTDLAGGAAAITVTAGSTDPQYHTLQYDFQLTDNIQKIEYMIPFFEHEFDHFENFLMFFKAITGALQSGTLQVIKSWKHRPVKCYIPDYVNANGVDYGFELRRAAQRWMDKSGFELFAFVDEPPDTGIAFHYKSRSSMGIQIAITRHTLGSDGHPMIDDIDVVTDFISSDRLYIVGMHELGHTIHLAHLPYQDYIMYHGAALPSDITDDEAKAAKLLASLPPLIDFSAYDESNP